MINLFLIGYTETIAETLTVSTDIYNFLTINRSLCQGFEDNRKREGDRYGYHRQHNMLLCSKSREWDPYPPILLWAPGLRIEVYC